MSCIDKNSLTRISFLIDDFFVSAGGVLLNEKELKVLIVKKVKTGEYLLPKGTKEENETIEETAVREVYEETGFLNELTEPAKLLAIQIRPHVRVNKGQHKVIYWFYNRLVCDDKHEGTQEDYEDFQTECYSFDDAMRNLSYEEDKRLVRSAFENSSIPTKSYQLAEKAEPKSLLKSAQSNGIIRIMLLDNEFTRSSAFVTFDTSKENVLLYSDCNDCYNLLRDDFPINFQKVKIQKLQNQKPFAFQLIAQENDKKLKIFEWYIFSLEMKNSSLAEQQIKWFPVSDALKLLTNNDELNILKLAMKLV